MKKFNQKEYNKEWRLKNKEWMRQYDLEHKSQIPVRASALWCYARKRAEKKNMPFTITREWVENKIQSGKCEVTGESFEILVGKGTSAFAPSIERINNNEGYTSENCQVVTWIYNRAKGSFSESDFKRFAKSLIKVYSNE